MPTRIPGTSCSTRRPGKLTFLDLGLVGELRQEQRFDLLALLWALRMEDPQALAGVARRLCVATGPVDEAAYQTAVERLFYQYWIYGSSSFSRMMSALFGTLRAHNLRMRRELTLAVKAMTQSEELMRAIDPDMPLVQTAAQEAEHLLRQQFTPERIAKLLRGELANVVQGAMGRASDLQQELIPVLLAAVTGGRIDLGQTTPDGLALASLESRVDGLGQALERQGRHLVMVVGLAASVPEPGRGDAGAASRARGSVGGGQPGRRRSPGSSAWRCSLSRCGGGALVTAELAAATRWIDRPSIEPRRGFIVDDPRPLESYRWKPRQRRSP